MRRPHLTRDQYGGTKLVNLVWLSLALTGVYFGVMYVPVYAEKWEVKSMLQDVGNSNWRNYDQEAVKQAIITRCKEYNKGDTEVFVLDPENIYVEKDETIKKLTLRITWMRIIPYPFLKGKQTQKAFSQQFEIDTNPVKY